VVKSQQKKSDENIDDTLPHGQMQQQQQQEKDKRLKSMRVGSGEIQNLNVKHIVKRKSDEEKRLREMTIPKKHKRLYDKIKYTQKKKRQEVEKLKSKRAAYDESQQRQKKMKVT